MYVEKEQWFTLIIVGAIFVIGINIWAAKRDAKLFNSPVYEEYIQQQLNPQLPESKWQQTHPNHHN